MPRIQLRVYSDPGSVEVFLNIRQKDGNDYRLTGVVDTGAAVSLLPVALMPILSYRTIGDAITIEQAGIARQAFTATEAIVTLFLEDQTGMRTNPFDATVWFADTDVVLIGFKDILERSVFHLDMRNTQTGWIELD